MKQNKWISFIWFSCLFAMTLSAQRQRDIRDYTKRDSIPVGYEEIPQERLNIKHSLKFTDNFTGNFTQNQSTDFRHIGMLEYGFELKKIPILLNVGREDGAIYDQNCHRYLFSVKLDFLTYLETLKNKTNLSNPIAGIDPRLSEDILKEELKKKINEELQSKLPTAKLDSLQNQLESMKNYEKKINTPQEIENIKQRKIMLREYALGNKIEGYNYDSLSLAQKDFDMESQNYQLNQKNPELTTYRDKQEEILNNKEKILDLKNKTEGRIQNLQNGFRLQDKLSLSRLKVTKFNLGQSSIDNAELVFRGFMVNGINVELKSPFYFNAVYSLPFQTNFFSNYQVNSIQNNQVSTLGGAIGISPEKKLNAQIGYYRFQEQGGNFSLRDNTQTKEISNNLLFITGQWKLKKGFQTKLEIAQSETNKFPNQSLFSTNGLSTNTAVKWTSEIDLLKTNTKLKLDLQRVGLNYYSSANPFIQRGTGGQIQLEQKIASKFQFKTKFSYRYSDDSNRTNSNLTTYGQLRYKMNRNTTLEGRVNYFENKIRFGSYYSNIINRNYSLLWQQRIKSKKLQHNILTSAQFNQTQAHSSPELNNSGKTENGILTMNYNLTHSQWLLNANAEDNYSLDSSRHILSNGLNYNYTISPKTQIGLGYQMRFANELIQWGYNLNFNTQIGKIQLMGTLQYLNDKQMNTKIWNPVLRMSYQIF